MTRMEKYRRWITIPSQIKSLQEMIEEKRENLFYGSGAYFDTKVQKSRRNSREDITINTLSKIEGLEKQIADLIEEDFNLGVEVATMGIERECFRAIRKYRNGLTLTTREKKLKQRGEYQIMRSEL